MATNPFLRLLRVLAGDGHDELRRQIQYLKAENEVLRSKLPARVRVTPEERSRLAKLAKPLGSAIKALVSIVKPETVMRWIREADRSRTTQPKKAVARKSGRPCTPEDIRRLVLKIARETGWGYTRILGELKKLGITGISRSTVVNILKRANLPVGPKRGELTWDQFINSHAKTLWACDFLQQRVVTFRGIRDAYLLVFVNVATRRAIATTSTQHPDAEWVATQVKVFKTPTRCGETQCRVLTRDRDTKFGKPFDEALREQGITPISLPHCAPNPNAHVERFIQTLQVECLHRFIVMGTSHLDHLTAEFIDHYNRERPHSSLEFATPAGKKPTTRAGPAKTREIRCRQRLGGVIKHYYRKAA